VEREEERKRIFFVKGEIRKSDELNAKMPNVEMMFESCKMSDGFVSIRNDRMRRL